MPTLEDQKLLLEVLTGRVDGLDHVTAADVNFAMPGTGDRPIHFATRYANPKLRVPMIEYLTNRYYRSIELDAPNAQGLTAPRGGDERRP